MWLFTTKPVLHQSELRGCWFAAVHIDESNTFEFYHGDAFKPKKTVQTVQHGGGSIKLWDCVAASGTGQLHKVDRIIKGG